MSVTPDIGIKRLGSADVLLASTTLQLMAEVFEEPCEPLREPYLQRLLGREDFWLLAALDGDRPVGGLTAWALPLTRVESSEIFIYDLAVHPRSQRKGVGRRLVQELRRLAAVRGMLVAWVPADNEDEHALEFYRAIGGSASPVTIFTFTTPPAGPARSAEA